MNENINTANQNLQDAAKVVLRDIFITIKIYIKKQEISQINNIAL